MDKEKRCKKGHPIGRGQLVLMQHVVGVCTCGHVYFHSEIPVVFAGDRRNKLKERFHHYDFMSPQFCPQCKKWLTGITISCQNHSIKEWVEALEKDLQELAFMEGIKVHHDEDLRSTPNNRSYVQ